MIAPVIVRYVRFTCPHCTKLYEVKEPENGKSIDIAFICECKQPIHLIYPEQQLRLDGPPVGVGRDEPQDR